jgi:predicted HicB family RNase H-like nuclease
MVASRASLGGSMVAAMQPSDGGMVALTLRVPAELHAEARRLSVQRKESINSILSRSLSQWVAWAKEQESK